MQGGVAIIAQLPIFTDYANSSFLGPMLNGRQLRFWGFVTVISKISDLLSTVGFERLTSTGMEYQLVNKKAGKVLHKPSRYCMDCLLVVDAA